MNDWLTPYTKATIRKKRKIMTKRPRTNWRVAREHERRRTALVNLLETGERQIDRLRAEELLQGLDANREQYKAGLQALKEVELLRQDNATLVAEVARLTADLAKSETAGNEAIDTLERERSERTQ